MHTRGQVLGSHLHTATPNAAACVLSEIQVLKLVLKHCTEPFPGAACGPHAKMSLWQATLARTYAQASGGLETGLTGAVWSESDLWAILKDFPVETSTASSHTAGKRKPGGSTSAAASSCFWQRAAHVFFCWGTTLLLGSKSHSNIEEPFSSGWLCCSTLRRQPLLKMWLYKGPDRSSDWQGWCLLQDTCQTGRGKQTRWSRKKGHALLEDTSVSVLTPHAACQGPSSTIWNSGREKCKNCWGK